jgi:hypothetical protein
MSEGFVKRIMSGGAVLKNTYINILLNSKIKTHDYENSLPLILIVLRLQYRTKQNIFRCYEYYDVISSSWQNYIEVIMNR